MQAGIKWAYLGAMLLLWLLVAALGVEAFARAQGLLSEWRYAGYFEEQTAKVYRMAPADEVAKQYTLPAGKATALPAPAASTNCDASPAERDAARDAFASKNDEARQVVTTVRGELRASLSPARELLDIEGDPYLEEAFRRGIAPNGSLFNFHPGMAAAIQQLQAGQSAPPTPHALDGKYNIEAGVDFSTPDRITVLVREVPPLLVLPDPPLGAEVSSEIPGVRYKRNWRPEGALGTYNNYGFRDDDVFLPKPPGLYRIVCIGGSTTEEGNTNETTYPNIVERKLQAAFGKGRVEVINAGISGIHSYNERRRIEDFLELDPDLIVYYNGVNDATHMHMHRWRDMAPPAAKRLLWSRILTRAYNRSLLPDDAVLSDFMRRTTFRNLRAMAYRAKECGVDFAVCSFAYPRMERLNSRDRVYLDMNFREVYNGAYLTYPTYTAVMDLHNQLVREVCAEDGLIYLPVAEQLDAGVDHFFDLCHMTPLGLELKTDIIGGLLQPVVAEKL